MLIITLLHKTHIMKVNSTTSLKYPLNLVFPKTKQKTPHRSQSTNESSNSLDYLGLECIAYSLSLYSPFCFLLLSLLKVLPSCLFLYTT